MPAPLKMQIFLCEKEGQLLNALIVTAIGDTAIYLLGATTDEGTKLKGAYLLQWRAIQWLKERGCRWTPTEAGNAPESSRAESRDLARHARDAAALPDARARVSRSLDSARDDSGVRRR